MQQPFGKFLMFRNRLEKVYRHLNKQAKRQAITCYRIYDHDLPEFPLIIEIYEDKLHVSEYKRRHLMSEPEHEDWLHQCTIIMADVIQISEENIFLKTRKKKEGRGSQYQKAAESKNESIVHENGLKFIVNLSDYLDTGLFLDHRITRQLVKDISDQKRVLNLFSYTGSFSVYAVAGNASDVVSIDLSKTYLEWAFRNMGLNFPECTHSRFIQADATDYVKKKTG